MRELMVMISIILFAIFPSFVFVWDLVMDFLYKLRVNKVDQAFDSIIRDVEEDDMEEETDEYVSVAVVEDKAYWVSNNTFYVAELIDGEIDKSSSRPINPFEMSGSDIRKMLFILDNLVEG
jgi:hypothetical protein